MLTRRRERSSGLGRLMWSKRTPHTELEIRLGKRCGESAAFNSTCDYDLLDAALLKIESSEFRTHLSDWEEFVDYYYTYDGVSMRTRAHANSETFGLDADTVTKRKVATAEYIVRSSKLVNHVARIQRSEEIPANPPTIVTALDRVVLQQRRSLKIPQWKYDFSLRWVGSTLAEAEQARETSLPECAIELEFDGEICPAAEAQFLDKFTKLLQAALDDRSLTISLV